ncbi:MAG: site-2 protease family protein, partial [Clostridia bacterium]|nr:site-2 protease family protein [Clostridia bacterium]
MQWLAVVVVLGGLVFFHELGHFLAAKRAGVQVDEFALGFGPLVWGRRWGETLYSLRLLPLGGFVRMAGMYPEGELPPDERIAAAGARPGPVAPGRGFNDKPVGTRMGIIAAGPLMNVLLAIVLFVVSYGVLGVPQPTLTVDGVVQGMPAAAAGLRAGDRIVEIDGQRLRTWDDLRRIVQAAPGKPLAITVARDGERQTVRLVPVAGDGGRGVIGVYPRFEDRRFGLLQAVAHGLGDTVAVVSGWFVGIAALVAGHGGGGVMGPV